MHSERKAEEKQEAFQGTRFSLSNTPATLLANLDLSQ